MGIFSRLTDIINSNLNSLIERAEDPEKMVRLMIQEMEDTLVEVRSQAVKAIADKREIERRLETLEKLRAEWESKAEFALTKGREDLAKGALAARHRIGEQTDRLAVELAALEEAQSRHQHDLSLLQEKLDEAKARKKALEVRMRTARDRVRIKQSLHDHVKGNTVEQVGTKLARLGEHAQIDIGNADHANIHREGLAATDADELTVLEDPQ